MTMYGANPEQLANLGATLRNQIQGITAVMTTVKGALNGTMWSGPAKDQFEHDWDTSFKAFWDEYGAASKCVSKPAAETVSKK